MKRLILVSVIVLTMEGLASAQPEDISVASMPPVVVKTVPRSGDTSVDSSISEIRVTFSKDMMDGSWSWAQISDESSLPTAGKARYLADRRTCVLPVKLQPGKTYVTWLNSEKYGNFKDAQGHSAVPYLLVFETGNGSTAPAGRPSSPRPVQSDRNWGPEQATGPPDTPRAGDFRTAWASLTPDGQQEWLVLEYLETIKPAEIQVYESYNPGAISKITVFDPGGKEVEIGKPGPKGIAIDGGVVVSKFPVKVDFPVRRVKLYLDSPRIKGWNEIDAVGLVDGQGKTHWAAKAEASSTFADRRSGPFVVTSPPPPEGKIPEGAVQVSHVDDTADGKRSFGGSGQAVLFERPAEAKHVAAIQIFASRYGHSRPPNEDFHVYLLDQDHKVIKDLTYPYSMIERGAERWYTLAVPSVEVPEKFHVALSFNAHRTKGVYVGINEGVEETHSLIGLPDSGYKPVTEGYDWMVRVYLTPGGDVPAE